MLILVHKSGDIHISFTWNLTCRHEMLTDSALVSIPARHTITIRVRDNITNMNVVIVLRSLLLSQSNRQHSLARYDTTQRNTT